MFQAILNVLAIIVLALAAGFIVLLLVDLILGCIDGKRGVLFFRNRKNTDIDNEILYQYNRDLSLNDAYYLQNNDKKLVLDFDKQYEKENVEEKTNNIDFSKADEEEKLLESKIKPLEEPETLEEEKEEPKEEVEVNEDFTFVNKVSPEVEKEIDEEVENNENEQTEEEIEEKEENLSEEDDFSFLDDDDDDDDKSIEEILNAIKERNIEARNKFLQEQEIEPDFEEEPEEPATAEELAEEKEELTSAVENVENEEPVVDEIALLKQQIEELNKRIEEEQEKNKEIEEKAKLDVENLKKELENRPMDSEEYTQEDLESFEIKLKELQERQKQNEKDLKMNKKDYIPLARIARTLESDQEKLRRREAIVAKKKMVLFGVNNYEVDEEKEQKLREEIDLLDGLRMSVEHCKNVMDANKDRYPVLKKSNEILTRNAEQIESDIKEIEEKIAKAKEQLTSSSGDDSTVSEN